MELIDAETVAIGAAVASAVVAYLAYRAEASSRSGRSADGGGDGQEVDGDAWVYMQCEHDEGAEAGDGGDAEDEDVPPYSPKDARRDSEEWNRTLVQFDTSAYEEELRANGGGGGGDGDDDDQSGSESGSFSDDDDAPVPVNDDSDGDLSPGSPRSPRSDDSEGTRRRIYLRKQHRRSWTHTNLDGTTDQRIHKRASPYKDGQNTIIVKEPMDAPVVH